MPTRTSQQKLRSERLIQQSILRWLKRAGLLHWRQHAGKFYNMKSGLPDIVVVLSPYGRLLGLEVKKADGKLRATQKVMRKRLTEAGAMYTVVRSLKGAQQAVSDARSEGSWDSGFRFLRNDYA